MEKDENNTYVQKLTVLTGIDTCLFSGIDTCLMH